MKNTLLALAGIAGLAAGIAWWLAQRPKPLPVVEVARVVSADIVASFTADGLVKGKRYEIQTTAPMRVVEVLVEEGERVRAGQVLVTLDSEAARAAVREALAGVATARADAEGADRAVQWVRSQADAQESRARSDLAAAEAHVRLLKAGARPEDLAQAEHRVELALSAADEAFKSMERARRLFQEGVVSLADLQRAEAREATLRQEYEIAVDALASLRSGSRPDEIQAAQASAAAARAQLRLAQSAAQEVAIRLSAARAAHARLNQTVAAAARAQSAAGETRLKAPAAGVVSAVAIEAGETASPGVAAVTLVDPANLYVEAEIGDEDTSKVRVGQDVAIIVPSAPGRQLRARISSIAAEAESKPELSLRTRIVRARIEVLGDRGSLRPGMEVDVEGKGVTARATLTMPSDALLFKDNRDVVYVVVEGIVKLREVRVGYRTATVTEIIGGLREGDTVVTSGKDALEDGAGVRVKGS